MKMYTIKSKEDVRQILNSTVGNNWSGQTYLINQIFEINNLQYHFYFNHQGSTFLNNGHHMSFEEVVNIIWNNRKCLNQEEL